MGDGVQGLRQEKKEEGGKNEGKGRERKRYVEYHTSTDMEGHENSENRTVLETLAQG